MRALASSMLAAAVIVAMVSPVRAFCGFYVSGAEAELFANASMVVLMREGTRTVMSMQNDYQGPPSDFALVVPVPEVLQKENVKTLPDAIFDRVDKLAAPRLVEYWEQDPCEPPVMPMRSMMERALAPGAADEGLGVTVEAEFEVGEYDVVILGARDSAGLDTWLRRNDYNIPEGAAPVLRPYVQGGMKFFVAKVNAKRVEFRDGKAVLSPLRFYYDSEDFFLPVRLGLLNSSGKQHVIVHILARGQRYRAANYDNAFIPTNLVVTDETRDRFGAFYSTLFETLQEQNPRAAITEYAWDASSCDPCPEPALDPGELATLGADVLPGGGEPPSARAYRGFVLTRLHMAYDADSLGEDLIFEAAPPVSGGRGVPGPDGKLDKGVEPARVNTFQGRYVMLNPWTGPVKCDDPHPGRWGGPPGGGGEPRAVPAADMGFERTEAVRLSAFVTEAVPGLEVRPATGASADEPSGGGPGKPPPAVPAEEGGCASCAVGAGTENAAPAVLAGAAFAALLWLRRRRR